MDRLASIAKVVVTVALWVTFTTFAYHGTKSFFNVGVLGYSQWINVVHAFTYYLSMIGLLFSIGVTRFIEKPTIPTFPENRIKTHIVSMGFWIALSMAVYYWLKPTLSMDFTNIQSYTGYVANVQGLMMGVAIISIFPTVGLFILLERLAKRSAMM